MECSLLRSIKLTSAWASLSSLFGYVGFQFLAQYSFGRCIFLFHAYYRLCFWICGAWLPVTPGAWTIVVLWGHNFMWGEASTFSSPAYNSSGRKIWLRLSKINSPLGWVQEWKILAGNNGLSENIGVTANWGICTHHRRLHVTIPPPPQQTHTILCPPRVWVTGSMEGGRQENSYELSGFFHCQTNLKALASGVMGGLAFILRVW